MRIESTDSAASQRPPSDPDDDVVRAVLRGDASSYGELVNRHQQSLVRMLAGIVSDAHLAEDIAQEVWWIAYRKLEGFGFRSRFRTWLHRIAVREALSARNRVRRFLARGEAITETIDPCEGETSTASEETLRALARLPAAERAAFSLYLEDLSYDEIASALGCPSGTVATHIHRARQRLARAFEDTRRSNDSAPRAVPTERERTP